MTLCCGHNFCKSCVSRSWEHRHHVCPVCKEASSFDDLHVNHTLNNLVEMILKEEGQRRGRAAALCPLHHEEAKLFCLEDKELACFACQSSKQHEGHKMRPVQETAVDFRVRDAPGRAGVGGGGRGATHRWHREASGGVQPTHTLAQTRQLRALARARRGCTHRRAGMKDEAATLRGWVPTGVPLPQRCPTLSLPNNYPVPPRPPGHGRLPCAKGDRGDPPRGLAWSPAFPRLIHPRSGWIRPRWLLQQPLIAAALWGWERVWDGGGCCTIPPAREGHGMGRKLRAPRGRTSYGCVGRRKRRRRTPARSWASCQDPPCLPAGKAAVAALTQPTGDEPDFKWCGVAVGLLFCKAWRAALSTQPPWEGSSGCCGTGRDLKGLKTGRRIHHGAKLLCLAA